MNSPAPPELLHFELLDREEQERAIRRLAREGMSEYAIAAATRLSVEMIRRVLAVDAETNTDARQHQ